MTKETLDDLRHVAVVLRDFMERRSLTTSLTITIITLIGLAVALFFSIIERSVDPIKDFKASGLLKLYIQWAMITSYICVISVGIATYI